MRASNRLVERHANTRLVGAGVAMGVALLASGCGVAEAPIVDPKGPIALAERDILLRAFAIMMIVFVPVFVMAFWFAWRYRASSGNARYEPDWMSNRLDALVWFIPALIVLSLAVHVWIYTHELDPYRRIDPSAKPLEVEVIAQDWKWLFVYPEQRIAAVNELAFPSAVPVRFKITSDTVMNSFFIPALGGQIYAMAGMRTELNLRADAPGKFVGRNTQYSGDGFADQHFTAVAMSEQDFDTWVEEVRQSPKSLDAASYAELAKPSIAHPVVYYATVEPGLFDAVIRKYRSPTTGQKTMAPR
jgi:cytochrome o ubiquinol oxidase subunit 2